MDEVGANGVPDPLARASQQSITSMGMWLLIASLSILFVSSILGIIIIRYFGHVPRPPALPSLPAGLWLSTGLLLLSSFTLYWALNAARADDQPTVRWSMTATFVLGVAFLINQIINWTEIYRAGLALTGFYALSFYFLTVLHAAHVLGGIIPMGFVTRAAYRGFYTRTSHHGLKLLNMYWHFLDIVWLVLFGVLFTALQ